MFAWAAALTLLCPALCAQSPRLTIWIVADQFRADYLQRYQNDVGTGGLQLMQSEGASFRRMRFDHAATFTASGAATLSSGAYSETHGVVANSWYDPRARQVVSAIGSRQLPTPSALNGSTLADELNLATGGESRIVAISDDPRLAVLLAGNQPLACLWRGPEGEIRSSAYYAAIPKWATDYEAANPVDAESRQDWRALGASAGSPPLRVLTGEHYIDRYRASPFAVEDVFGLARAAIENEHLGQDDVPDLLILGVGATGLLALETGAYSPLMRDLAVRLDANIAGLLAWLTDAGLQDQSAVVFTATHGIPPQQADIARANLPGGSIAGGELVQSLNTALVSFPGVRVTKYVFPNLYFNDAFQALSAEARQSAVRAAGVAALKTPGVAAYYAPAETSAVGDLKLRLEHSFYPGRSGDMMLAYAPYFVESYGDGRGTASGSPHAYDTDVPLLFYGRWFQRGFSEDIADATSVAPTLAQLLGIAAPSGSTGRVLSEALLPDGPPPSGPPAPAEEP